MRRRQVFEEGIVPDLGESTLHDVRQMSHESDRSGYGGCVA
jgi:hypothetical protein